MTAVYRVFSQSPYSGTAPPEMLLSDQQYLLGIVQEQRVVFSGVMGVVVGYCIGLHSKQVRGAGEAAGQLMVLHLKQVEELAFSKQAKAPTRRAMSPKRLPDTIKKKSPSLIPKASLKGSLSGSKVASIVEVRVDIVVENERVLGPGYWTVIFAIDVTIAVLRDMKLDVVVVALAARVSKTGSAMTEVWAYSR